MMLIMICLERYIIHIIHWIICYHRNVFLLIYEHALVILSSYPSTLYCCIKKSFIVRVLHKHVVLFGHWLDFVCDCYFFYKRCFCMCVCHMNKRLLTYLLTTIETSTKTAIRQSGQWIICFIPQNKSNKVTVANTTKAQHSVHYFLPPARLMASLSERGHTYTLPDFNTNTHKRSFIILSLCKPI